MAHVEGAEDWSTTLELRWLVAEETTQSMQVTLLRREPRYRWDGFVPLHAGDKSANLI